MELAAQLGAYGVEPALVFNDSVAAREGLEPLTRIPGIARLRVLNDVGRPVTEWTSPTADPAPILSRIFFPRPFAVTVEQIGRAHVCTPVTKAPLVCRLLLEKKK